MAPASPLSGWFVVTGAVLILSLLAAFLVQARQYALLNQAVRGQDAVISAYNPGWQHPDLYATYLRGAKAIADGVKQAGVKRLLVVGGAGSLFVAPGVQLVDTPEFAAHMPPFVIPGARAARDELTRLRGEKELDWTLVSPAAGPFQIPRTGKYRVGGEEVLMAGAQPADVAREDLALAIVDEIEAPKHVRARFTVATA